MNRIKELRILNRKSQAEITDMLHVNRTTLTKWETGKHNPDIDTIVVLADYFNVSTDYLLGRTNDPTPPNVRLEELSLEELIRNRTDLSEQSKRDMLMQLKLVKIRDMTEEKIAETEFNFRPAHC